MSKQVLSSAFEPELVAKLDAMTVADGGTRSETLRRVVGDGLRLSDVREAALRNPSTAVHFVDATGAIMSLTFHPEGSL